MEKRKTYRLWATKGADCFNEQTFQTLEEAINEADWLWKHERYESIQVSSEECLDEDGCPADHDVVWEDGDWTGEWADEL